MKYTFIILFATVLFSCKDKQRKETVGSQIANINISIGDTLFGIDVSSYKGIIDYDKVASQKDHDIKFVIARASMGDDRKDSFFVYNFTEAKKKGYKVGSYHYFDSDEDPVLQAWNYIESVDSLLKKGDFIPVLDVEHTSKVFPKDVWIKNIDTCLDIIEKKFGVKPILYTGLKFYEIHLAGKGFDEHKKWIAAYDPKRREDPLVKKAHIFQFTDRVKVKGIKVGTADGNDINRLNLYSLLLTK